MDHQDTTLVDEVWRKAQSLEARDAQLWSLNVLVILAVVVGFVAVVLPNVRWNLGTVQLGGQHIPELLLGLLAVILLFNMYALWRQRELRSTRMELVRILVRSGSAERRPLVDPLTEVFNRRYLDQFLAPEVGRTDRRGGSLTFLLIDVDGFTSLNARFGHLIGDRVLSRVGQLLKETFRGSDTLIRNGSDEFLVLMQETNEQQAQRALERLLMRVDDWNRENAIGGFKLSFSCGLATYTRGADIKEVLETANQRMRLKKAAYSAAQ